MAAAPRAVVDANLPVAALRDLDDDRILRLTVRTEATVVAHDVRDLAYAERFGVDLLTPVQLLCELGVLQ